MAWIQRETCLRMRSRGFPEHGGIGQIPIESPLPMPTPTYTVECTSIRVIARDVYEIRFTKPDAFTFKGGQFILFDVPHPDNAEDIQARAYSIASAPHEPELMFVIKLTPGGRASRWIEKKLHPGSKTVMKGPFGMFTLKEGMTHDLLFIGTSTGIAPFRSQILEQLQRGDHRRMDLVYGVRAEEDLFWKQELTELTQQHGNVSVHFALSQPSDAWTGHKGRVQTLVPLIEKDLAARGIYVCGSPVMTKELKQLCLEHWGVQKSNLHVEGYI
jgi:ferredoxin-NADP reductase